SCDMSRGPSTASSNPGATAIRAISLGFQGSCCVMDSALCRLLDACLRVAQAVANPSRMPTPQEIQERLKAIPYPGFSRDIVSFGLIQDIEVSSAGVTVRLAPTTAQDDVVATIEAAVRDAVMAMPGVANVELVRMARPAGAPRGRQPIPGVRSVLAVASGKGGVGKSTVAT